MSKYTEDQILEAIEFIVDDTDVETLRAAYYEKLVDFYLEEAKEAESELLDDMMDFYKESTE